MRPQPSRTRWAAANSAGAAYANMRMSTPTAFPSLGAAYEPIDDVFDTEIGTSEKIVADVDQGTFVYQFRGRYQILLNGSFNHNSSNQGRTVNLRLQNITDDLTVALIPIGIGRNVEDTVIPVIGAFDIDASQIGKTVQFQLGGGDSVTGITFNALQAGTHLLSGYPV